jgi:CubicO group peptidase (beta-lactamase class C family)
MRISLSGAFGAALSAFIFSASANAADLPVGMAEDAGLSSERLARIETHFAREVAVGHRAGYVAMVARDGQVVYEMATGQRDIAAGLDMTMDTRFRIASMTKAITSVAAMILIEDGKMHLGDRLSNYLPEFSNMCVAAQTSHNEAGELPCEDHTNPITIEMLMMHTSGLGYLFDSTSDLGNDLINANLMIVPNSLAEFSEQLATYPLYFQPGSKWQYSYALDVLGRVIEVVSGMSFEDYVQAEIFDPLGMDDSRFILNESYAASVGENLATIYEFDDNGQMVAVSATSQGLNGESDTPQSDIISYPAGGAGIISSAPDYMRFLLMLANGGVLGDTRILSSYTVGEMTRNRLSNDIRKQLGAEGQVGFGLSFLITLDAGRTTTMDSDGEFAWGGYFDTTFFVAPNEEGLIGILMTARVPGPNDPTNRTREDFRGLVYTSIID